MLHHKASGRAYSVLPSPGGKRNYVYFGAWGSQEADREYARFVAKLAASPDRAAFTSDTDLTLNELLLRYVRHAEGYYLGPDGLPSALTPHRPRYLAAVKVRAAFGVDVARAVLGHSLASVTEIYSHEVDKGLAMKAAREMG